MSEKAIIEIHLAWKNIFCKIIWGYVSEICIYASPPKHKKLYSSLIWLYRHPLKFQESVYLRQFLFGIFPKRNTKSKFFQILCKMLLTNQIITNFFKDSIDQIQITPNTPKTPQITPNTNILWLFVVPNVKAWSYKLYWDTLPCVI